MKEPVIAPAAEKPANVNSKKNLKPEKTKFTGYQVFVVALLALLHFSIILDFMILSPLGDILMKSLNMSPAQFGTVVAAYALSAGVSGFLAAGFADKYDRKKLLLFFYTGFVIGTLFCGLANSYATLLAARIITGIFGGVIGSISMAILTDIFNVQLRGRVMGFVQMGFAVSQIMGIPLGLTLAEKFNDWHVAFFMVVALTVVVWVMIVAGLKPITEHLKLQKTTDPLKHFGNTLLRKEYRVGYLATAMLSMGGFMLMPFTTAFLVNNVQIPQENINLVFFYTGIASVIIMPLIGKLSDRFDKFRLFTVGSVIACVMVVIYTNLGPSPLWHVVLINMILFMGIMSRMVPATTLNSAVPDAADRGAYMSINSSLQQMAGGLAAIFAGLVVIQESKTSPIQNFNILGYIMVGLILLCLYFVFRVSRQLKSKGKI